MNKLKIWMIGLPTFIEVRVEEEEYDNFLNWFKADEDIDDEDENSNGIYTIPCIDGPELTVTGSEIIAIYYE